MLMRSCKRMSFTKEMNYTKLCIVKTFQHQSM